MLLKSKSHVAKNAVKSCILLTIVLPFWLECVAASGTCVIRVAAGLTLLTSDVVAGGKLTTSTVPPDCS